MLELRDHMMKTLKLPTNNPPNSVNINWYKNGSAGIGAHSDDEVLFQGLYRPIKIVSFSLGAVRRFEVYHYDNTTPEGMVAGFDMPNASYITMEGNFQRDYKHKIPVYETEMPPRLNITWRWVVKHNPEC